MDKQKFNEDSRVKIPAILHFRRLGYTYQSKIKANIDTRNNIFVDVFKKAIRDINGKDYSDAVLDGLIKEIATLTDNDKDKGMGFYQRLVNYNSIKLIDLENPLRNDFRVVSELTYRGERDEFRPDITILINGIPLGFMEVKKPNNQNGIQKEFDRMKYRLKSDDFTHFFNQLQVLGFSNNQPYDDGAQILLQGSFYTTPNGDKAAYNHFREEMKIAVNEYLDDNDINNVLSDNNIMSIKHDTEFIDNLSPDTYTNEFITSLFSKERLIFFIRYGIVYVDSLRDGLNKHIIRYPQFFGIQRLIEKLKLGMRRGILWHTQGSGKTAFSYFATNVLRDYFQADDIITKFYFVVDRLDLLKQAKTEFQDRGLSIAEINSKNDFATNMKSPVITSNTSQRGIYKETMNVVNIQKFSDESTVDITGTKGVQRIYFLDEVHRGYKPKGVFLANLLGADPNGLYIGLTGTPILNDENEDKSDRKKVKRKFKSTDLFQDYIHKYYYNKSIADGYTLKIKKENIATEFRTDVKALLGIPENKEIPPTMWKELSSEPIFVEQLCNYIQKDFELFVDVQKDKSLGFMIVTTGSEQAEAIQKWFAEKGNLKTALVLYDEDDNSTKQEEFRGKKDKETGKTVSDYYGVVVFNMLLTGFDAPRLKRLYLLRTIREHSLLQTLARVNRPYKNMKYGYIVDFVDITEEYETTNQRYLEELKADIVDEDDSTDINNMFVDVEKIKATIKKLENKLFNYMGNIETNLEEFRRQIQHIDEKTLREIKGDIEEYRECYYELKMSHEDTSKIPIDKLNKAFYEVSNRINLIVAERTLSEDDNEVDDIDYSALIVDFFKTGELDLDFATEDDILAVIEKITNAFSANADKKDSTLIQLQKKYKDILKKLKYKADTTQKVKHVLKELDDLYKEIQVLNALNNNLTNKYKGDDSCMRVHKRFREAYGDNLTDVDIYKIVTEVIDTMFDKVGHQAYPTSSVIIRDLLKPVRNIFRQYGYTLSPRQVEDIIYLFIEDKYEK
ncbi:MAG: restriction endonuclease subunit [Herbinix sp.]|jgi:type I restriction enzyme R subunit|nr:restriction endonuclease subunit [Herbinix sp.]